MTIALTRAVSPTLSACELEYLPRQPIDLARAIEQHATYEACLASLGMRVVSLPAAEECPDAVFVEDPAIVLDEIAVITRMGAEPRRQESDSLARAVSDFRPLRHITEPGTLEGGDVMLIGKTLFAGLSRRSNRDGVTQLAELVRPFDYQVMPVPVRGCLHLKSACCYLGDGTVLANRSWFDSAALNEFRIINVPLEEPAAANVLRIADTVVVSLSFPRTAELLEESGFHVIRLDTSELQKAEAGITCMSLRFKKRHDGHE